MLEQSRVFGVLTLFAVQFELMSLLTTRGLGINLELKGPLGLKCLAPEFILRWFLSAMKEAGTAFVTQGHGVQQRWAGEKGEDGLCRL